MPYYYTKREIDRMLKKTEKSGRTAKSKEIVYDVLVNKKPLAQVARERDMLVTSVSNVMARSRVDAGIELNSWKK